MGGIEAGTFPLPQRPHLCWALCLAQDAGQLLFPVPGVLQGTRCWVSSRQPQSTEALKVWADEKKRRKRTVHKYLQTVFETQSDVAKLCSHQLCWTPHLIFHCLLQCTDSYPQEQSCPGRSSLCHRRWAEEGKVQAAFVCISFAFLFPSYFLLRQRSLCSLVPAPRAALSTRIREGWSAGVGAGCDEEQEEEEKREREVHTYCHKVRIYLTNNARDTSWTDSRYLVTAGNRGSRYFQNLFLIFVQPKKLFHFLGLSAKCGRKYKEISKIIFHRCSC